MPVLEPAHAGPGSDAARQIAQTAQDSNSLGSLACIDFRSSVTSANLDFKRSRHAKRQIQSQRDSQTNSTPAKYPQPVGDVDVEQKTWRTYSRHDPTCGRLVVEFHRPPRLTESFRTTS